MNSFFFNLVDSWYSRQHTCPQDSFGEQGPPSPRLRRAKHEPAGVAEITNGRKAPMATGKLLFNIMGILIDNIIHQLKEVQEGKPWIGTSFYRKLDQIMEDEAFLRPLPDLHSVAEIISHLTAWRKETIVKIRTGKGSLTDESEENWLGNDILRKTGWSKLKTDYRNSLSELIDLLQARDDDFLDEKYYDADFKGHYNYGFVIYGMLHHDIYHLGQLGIIIRFLKEER